MSPPFGVLLASALLFGVVASSFGQLPEPPERSSERASTKSSDARSTGQQDAAAALALLEPRYRRWLLSVRGLISEPEVAYFLALRADFRRDAFMQEFWSVRDPDPLTPANELHQRWQELLQRQPADSLQFSDARLLLYLLNGPPGRWVLPDGRSVARCFSRNREIEIWFYGGSERAQRRFPVILYQRAPSTPYEVWRLGGNLRAAHRSGLPTTEIRLLCADELINYAAREISRVANYDQLLEEILSPPRPPTEWLATLEADTTDLPEGADTFDVAFSIEFPARNQSRTAVQVLAEIPRAEAPGKEFEGVLFHNFMVVGEILRDERIFEAFRYRFDGPTPTDATKIPIGFTRYLRPGNFTFRLLIEDLHSGRFSQIIEEVEVPSPEGRPSVASRNAILSADRGPTLELLAPSGTVHAGLIRFEARARGELDRVTFLLDDRQVLSKRRPPYSVEIDLGSAPAPHQVRVVGFSGGHEVATDQIWLNQGAQRFRVRMVEPRPGGIYPGGLTVRVEVDTPDGQPPQRVDLFVNDQRVTSIAQPPFSRGLQLPGADIAVIRAVAFLADGTSAEDAVIVNTSDYTERVAVQLVELHVLVQGENGKPVGGLEQSKFRILDEGRLQQIQSFAWTDDLPIQATILIDRSASMRPHLQQVTEAALGFARKALRNQRDRIALLSFADQPRIDVGLAATAGQIERGLAGLVATGGTALYDAIASALNSLHGVQGHKAVVLFTDGQDENSSLTFEQSLEGAQRSGISIYPIALAGALSERATRRDLQELADETGGRTAFVDTIEQLPAVYDQILAELRSRYLITYSVPEDLESGFHQLRVEVDESGVVVRTRGGYWKER